MTPSSKTLRCQRFLLSTPPCLTNWEPALAVSYRPIVVWLRTHLPAPPSSARQSDNAQIKAPTSLRRPLCAQPDTRPTNPFPVSALCRYTVSRHWPTNNTAASLRWGHPASSSSRSSCLRNDGWRRRAQHRERIQRCLLAFLALWTISERRGGYVMDAAHGNWQQKPDSSWHVGITT